MASFFENGVLIVSQGFGYEELAVSTSAVGPAAIPAGKQIRRMLIQVHFGDIRWLAVPGEDPTSSYGVKLLAGDFFVYDGPPEDITFIRDSASTNPPTLGIHYFGA
jgi:hypothetical protein